MALTKVSYSMITGAPVNVKDYGAAGNGVSDDTVAIQAAATAISLTGGTLYFPAGDYVITTQITVTGNNVCFSLDHNAGILYNTPTFVAIQFTGSNCSVIGGLGRGFIGPAAWDGANVPFTYGVIWFGGNNSIAKTRLVNIRKMGIWFKDVVEGTAEDCIIEGNYPAASWTGTETGHVGIGFDTSTANAGNFKIVNNTIKSCVQGCLPANYGAGGVIQGFVATGNIFDGCWNHGIYTNFTNGAVITGNNFNRCQIPIVISGDNNVISGNSMYTSVATVGDARDSIGISVRDGSKNVITGNTLKGTLDVSNVACINIQDINGTGQLNENIVSNNTINITAGTGIAIRILGNTNSCSRNIIESNNITCLGVVNQGAITISGLAAGGNVGNKISNNVIKLTADGDGIYASYQTSSELRGNSVEFAWNALVATNVYTCRLFSGTTCNTESNTSIVNATFGTNLTVYAYREDTTAVNNVLTNAQNAVAGAGTFAMAILVANGGLSLNQLGTGVPNLHARIGSVWRRTDGGAGSTLYIKESGTDATGWVAK